MRSLCRQFLGDRLGSVAIEFALVLPLYVLILSGGFELTMYALLHNKLQRVAGVMADTVSRQNVSRDTVHGLLSQSGQFMTPFGFANGKITISQIRNEDETDDASNMLISWQESFQGAATQLGSAGTVPAALPNNFEVLNEKTIIVSEISYSYTSFVFSSLIGDRTLYNIYITTPRGGKMNTLLGE